MNQFQRNKIKIKPIIRKLVAAILSLLLTFTTNIVPASLAFASYVPSGTNPGPALSVQIATLETDNPSYETGDMVIITGRGFRPNSQITLKITKPDPVSGLPTGEVLTFTVVSDNTGSFVYNYLITDNLFGTYLVEAYDGINQATVTFLDPPRPTMNPEPVETIGTVNTVSWQCEKEPNTYELQISSDQDFTNIIQTVNIISPTKQYTFTELTIGNTYYYRVRGIYTQGASNWSKAVVYSQQVQDLSDREAPGAPTNFTAIDTPNDSGGSIGLSWTASNDNVGVTGYKLYRGTTSGTYTQTFNVGNVNSYTDTTAISGITYYYAVTALDAQLNESLKSAEANAKAADNIPPTTPENLTAAYITDESGGRVNLDWSASTDIVGVTGYLIERSLDGSTAWTQIGNSTTTSYSDTTVSESTKYYYRVRAVDGANNASDSSVSVSITTPAAPDTQAPAVPTGLQATAVSEHKIDLSWTAATDNVGVTGYQIERSINGTTGWTQIGTSAATAYSDTTVSGSTTYYYRVKAVDAANNESDPSAAVSATTPAASDTQAPTVPTGLTATAVSENKIDLSWSDSTDNIGVMSYHIERSLNGTNGWTEIGTSITTRYSDTTVLENTRYYYRVKAVDAANNMSDPSVSVNATTPAAPDIQAPAAPTGLIATAVSESKIDLRWTASTDNVGVTSYRIERSLDGTSGWTQIGTTTTTSYSDITVSANTKYYYHVIALDAANNSSAPSTTVTATATASNISVQTIESDSQSAVYNGSEWSTSTHDNYSGGITRYSNVPGNYVTVSFAGTGVGWYGRKFTNRGIAKVYVDGVLQGTYDQYGSTSEFRQKLFQKTGLLNGSHIIKIEVTGTKNPSATDSVIEIDFIEAISELDFQAPSAPPGVTASAVSGSKIDLSWTASTDNAGVAGYRIERSLNGSSGWAQVGTSIATSFSDNTVSANTKYYYRVLAVDGFNNISIPSGVATTTTPDVTITRIESDSPSVWLTQWNTSTNESYSGGSTEYTNTAGYYLTVDFTGTGVSWYGRKFTNRGIAKVYIDDVLQGTYDQYGSVSAYQQKIFEKTGLKYGSHNLKIECTGTKNPSSTDVMIEVDFMEAIIEPDVQEPSVPSGLTITALSQKKINLSWIPSTDNVEVTEYRIERSSDGNSWTQIGNSTTTGYSDTTVAASKTYYYRVKAVDAANNVSNPSTSVNATTPAPDTETPSVPSGLSANALSGSRIGLSWTASTDNVGVTGYRIERSLDGNSGWIQIGTSSTTSYSDTTVSVNSTYYYRVIAADEAQNLSTPSTMVTATTPNVIVTKIESSSPSAAAIGSWYTSNHENYSGGNTKYTNSAGNYLSIGFSGTEVRWFGRRFTNRGIAKVYIDDVLQGTYDQYGSVSEFQAQIFEKTGLNYGSHNIKIECTGSKNPGATDVTIEVDFIEAITEPDVQAPSVPAGLSATALSQRKINLSWMASTDNAGVTGYRIERSLDGSSDWTQIGISTTTSYSDTTVSASTTYYYRVKAIDAANNVSNPSASADATTPDPDTQAPVTPTDVIVTTVSGTRIGLSWTASTDNVGVTGYSIERSLDGSGGWSQIGTSTITSYLDTTISANTTYYYRVIAVDEAQNQSTPSATTTVTTPNITVIKRETNYSSAVLTGSGWYTSIHESYSGGFALYTATAGDSLTVHFTGTGVGWYGRKFTNRGIAKVYIDDVLQGTYDQYGSVSEFQQQIFEKIGLEYGNHTIRIECTGTKNASATDVVIEVDFLEAITEPDVQAPTAPSGLSATTLPENKINLTWNASTDNVRIKGYRIERSLDGSTNWIQIGTSISTSYSDTTVLPSTTYYYRVKAVDSADNVSNPSASASALTPAPDTQAPTTPANLTATALSGILVHLSWTASTDDRGVTGYQIERSLNGSSGWSKIGTSTVTSYSDTALSPNTTYYYRVIAVDEANNPSAPSSVETVTTANTTKIEQDSLSAIYSGSDWYVSTHQSYSDGTTKYTNTAGNYVTINFTGTGVSWYGRKFFNRGIAKVYIDGVLQGNYDQYSAVSQFQEKIFEKAGLAAGNHTIKIEVTGTKNAGASDMVTEIDFIEVVN